MFLGFAFRRLEFVMTLDFSKLDGLLPAVIQDHATGRVLMVAFMNEEAFRTTVETGFATFYSRSRNKIWMKGESSGHRPVSYTHLRAHETVLDLVCRLLLEKKKIKNKKKLSQFYTHKI